jgi:hypothetical protein
VSTRADEFNSVGSLPRSGRREDWVEVQTPSGVGQCWRQTASSLGARDCQRRHRGATGCVPRQRCPLVCRRCLWRPPASRCSKGPATCAGLAHTDAVGVEWEVTDAATPEGKDAESGTTEELAGAEPMFHRSRAVWLLVVLACVAGSAVAVVATHHPRSQRRSAAPSATTVSSRSVASTAAEAAIARVRDLALTPGPLSSYIRATTGGGCVPAKPGVSPQQRITTAVDRTVSSYRVTDVGFVLEATDALCAMQVRARDGGADVLVVDVVAARAQSSDATGGHIVFGSHTDRLSTVEYASRVTRGGWQVTVGAVGSASQLPGIERLINLVDDPATRW